MLKLMLSKIGIATSQNCWFLTVLDIALCKETSYLFFTDRLLYTVKKAAALLARS